MSYILDALNKVEQTNRHREKPNLEAIIKPTKSHWPGILVTLLLVNLCGLAYLNWPTAPEPATPTTEAPVQSMTEASTTAVSADESVARTSVDYRPVISPRRSPVRISELPVQVQKQIPDMTFSSHIHAADPTLRMVNINGRNYFTGDQVADGIQLQEITESGVVLRFLHYTFEMSVVRDWAFE